MNRVEYRANIERMMATALAKHRISAVTEDAGHWYCGQRGNSDNSFIVGISSKVIVIYGDLGEIMLCVPDDGWLWRTVPKGRPDEVFQRDPHARLKETFLPGEARVILAQWVREEDDREKRRGRMAIARELAETLKDEDEEAFCRNWIFETEYPEDLRECYDQDPESWKCYWALRKFVELYKKSGYSAYKVD